MVEDYHDTRDCIKRSQHMLRTTDLEESEWLFFLQKHNSIMLLDSSLNPNVTWEAKIMVS